MLLAAFRLSWAHLFSEEIASFDVHSSANTSARAELADRFLEERGPCVDRQRRKAGTGPVGLKPVEGLGINAAPEDVGFDIAFVLRFEHEEVSTIHFNGLDFANIQRFEQALVCTGQRLIRSDRKLVRRSGAGCGEDDGDRGLGQSCNLHGSFPFGIGFGMIRSAGYLLQTGKIPKREAVVVTYMGAQGDAFRQTKRYEIF